MTWIENSTKFYSNTSNYNSEAAVVLIIFAGWTILHSWFIHRSAWKRVRIINDCVCLCSIGTGIAVLYSNTYQAQYNIALGADLFGYGIFSTTISVLDLIITYSRYKMLSIPLCYYQDLFVAMYIFILVVGSGLPFYTIVPFFIDVSIGDGLMALNTCLYYIFTPSVAFFNFFFAGVFYAKIVNWRFGGVNKIEQHPRMLILAYKSAIHAISSTCVSIYLAISSMTNPIQGQLCYCFVITGAIHFLFNCKIESIDCVQRIKKNIISIKETQDLYPFEVDYEKVIVKNDGIEMAIETGLKRNISSDGMGQGEVASDQRTQSNRAMEDTSLPNQPDVIVNAKRMGFI